MQHKTDNEELEERENNNRKTITPKKSEIVKRWICKIRKTKATTGIIISRPSQHNVRKDNLTEKEIWKRTRVISTRPIIKMHKNNEPQSKKTPKCDNGDCGSNAPLCKLQEHHQVKASTENNIKETEDEEVQSFICMNGMQKQTIA